jgi:hypothetical protein
LIFAKQTLSYGSVSWIIRGTDEREIDVNRNAFHEDCGINSSEAKKGIMRGLQIPQLIQFIEEHRRNCKENVDRMNPGRIPRKVLECHPKGWGKKKFV